MYDLFFGVLHSITRSFDNDFFRKFISGIFKRMVFNTIVFTILMIIIAFQLELLRSSGISTEFLLTFLTFAVGEFVVMAVGIPIMVALNKRLNFEKLI